MAASSPSSTTDSTSAAATKHKKTVTFKNILETSDDKSAVKKFYNPDNRTPLVSIMKKECMNRPLMYSRSECIVRPSRLTEILKNNSNIDKLNSLKFRSASSLALASAPTTSTTSIFGSNLLRAFGGVPDSDDDDEKDVITFRINNTVSQIKDDIETQNDDEEDNNVDNDEKASDNEEESQQQMIVDKHFVLPKRSTRSSRVIKPNKRFLDDAITMCKKTTATTAGRKLNTTLVGGGTNHTKKELHCNIFSLGQHNTAADSEEVAKPNLGWFT